MDAIVMVATMVEQMLFTNNAHTSDMHTTVVITERSVSCPTLLIKSNLKSSLK